MGCIKVKTPLPTVAKQSLPKSFQGPLSSLPQDPLHLLMMPHPKPPSGIFFLVWIEGAKFSASAPVSRLNRSGSSVSRASLNHQTGTDSHSPSSSCTPGVKKPVCSQKGEREVYESRLCPPCHIQDELRGEEMRPLLRPVLSTGALPS